MGRNSIGFKVVCSSDSQRCSNYSGGSGCLDGLTEKACKKRLKYIAMDLDGEWFGYMSKPYISEEVEGLFCSKEAGIPIEINWKKSIIRLEK